MTISESRAKRATLLAMAISFLKAGLAAAAVGLGAALAIRLRAMVQGYVWDR